MLIIQITKIVHHICYDCKCVSVFINQLHILWRVVVSQRVGLAMKRLRVWLPDRTRMHNDSGQVVHTFVPQPSRSTIWYRSSGGDALWLGR